jgi:hypothetical protein
MQTSHGNKEGKTFYVKLSLVVVKLVLASRPEFMVCKKKLRGF